MKSNCRLTLYVKGPCATSLRALKNLAHLCAVAIPGEYEVDVIDVEVNPERAEAEKIVYAPTLVKSFPPPLRRIAGDLSDWQRVLTAMDLPTSVTVGSSRAPKKLADSPLLRILAISADLALVSRLSDRLDGHAVVEAAQTLGAARGRLARGDYDVALVDYALPGDGGTAAITLLARAYPQVPFVALVDSPDPAALRAARLVGAEHVWPGAHLADPALAQRFRDVVVRHGAHAQFQKLLNASPDGMVVIDADTVVLYANAAAERILNRNQRELVRVPIVEPLNQKDGFQGRFKVGPARTVEARTSVVDWFGRTGQLICLRDVTSQVREQESSSTLISALKSTNARLNVDATHDPLTQVLNRRGLQEALHFEQAQGRRREGHITALLIDCDNFKGINDQFGHAAGDAALRVVADVIRRTIRPSDRVGRIGGDEFLVLLPSTQAAEAVVVGERVMRQLAAQRLPKEFETSGLSVSMGTARIESEVTSIEDVIAAASAPLKLAKAHGKRRVSLAASVEPASMDESLGSDVQRVMTDPLLLRVLYQDIVTLADGAAIGHELFIRGPRGALELPLDLFAVARSLDVAQSFDLSCLRTTLASASRLDASAWCHINILPATLQGAVGEQVLELLARRTAPIRLCLEIDAREMVGDPFALQPHRASLAAAGVKLALENAAFDAATLEALIILKPDIVKIAPAMVERATREAGRVRELRRLVHAAKGVGAEVVAAGVQVHESVELLTAMGITLGQGYLWNRPTELPDSDAG